MGGADGVLTLYEIGTERTPTEKVLLRLTLTLTLPLPLTLTLTLTLTQVLLRLSSYFGALPYISLYLPTSPYISLHLPTSPHISLRRLLAGRARRRAAGVALVGRAAAAGGG